MICAPSVGEEQAPKFETVFTAVRYICLNAQLKKDYLWYMNSTTDSYPIFWGGEIEDYYITLHTYSYSKTSNWCFKRNK